MKTNHFISALALSVLSLGASVLPASARDVVVVRGGGGYYRHRPVYVAPRPVYVAPAPVYVAPRPVYVAPRPVYVAPQPVVARSVEIDVQRALAKRGYFGGVIDGLVGPQTRAAIRAYQVDKGLPVTGVIDGALLRSLRLL